MKYKLTSCKGWAVVRLGTTTIDIGPYARLDDLQEAIAATMPDEAPLLGMGEATATHELATCELWGLVAVYPGGTMCDLWDSPAVGIDDAIMRLGAMASDGTMTHELAAEIADSPHRWVSDGSDE